MVCRLILYSVRTAVAAATNRALDASRTTKISPDPIGLPVAVEVPKLPAELVAAPTRSHYKENKWRISPVAPP